MTYSPLGTGCKFSRALHRFQVFPRLTRVTGFPALDTGYKFSRAWHGLQVFPRLTRATSFPALDTSHSFPAPLVKVLFLPMTEFFSLCPDWLYSVFVVCYSVIMVGFWQWLLLSLFIQCQRRWFIRSYRWRLSSRVWSRQNSEASVGRPQVHARPWLHAFGPQG